MYFAASVVEAESPGLEDGGDGLSDPPSWEVVIKVLGRGLALVNLLSSAHKPFKANITIPRLAAVTALSKKILGSSVSVIFASEFTLVSGTLRM